MHHLVAGYLQYKPEVLDPDEPDESDEPAGSAAGPSIPAPERASWMQGFGAVPASPELRDAATAEDALAAAERMFFGPLMEI